MKNFVVMKDYEKLSNNIFDKFYEYLSLLSKDKGYITDEYDYLLNPLSRETSDNDKNKLATIFFFEELTDDNYTDLIPISGTTINRSWLEITHYDKPKCTLEELKNKEKESIIIDNSISLLNEKQQKYLLVFFTKIYDYIIYASSNYKLLGFGSGIIHSENFVKDFKKSIFFMNENPDSYCMIKSLDTDLGLEDIGYSLYKKNGCIGDFIRNDKKILQEMKDILLNKLKYITICNKKNKPSFQNIVHIFNNIYHFCIKTKVSAKRSENERFEYTTYTYFNEKKVLENLVVNYKKYYTDTSKTIHTIEEVLKEIIKNRIIEEITDKTVIKLDIDSSVIYYKPFYGFFYENENDKSFTDIYYLGNSADEKTYPEYLFFKKHFDKVYPIRVDYISPFGYDIPGYAYCKKKEHVSGAKYTFEEHFYKEIASDAKLITTNGRNGIVSIPDPVKLGEDVFDFMLNFIDISGSKEVLLGTYRHKVGDYNQVTKESMISTSIEFK